MSVSYCITHVPLDTLFLVQELHSRNLKILFSSSPLPAHCSRHLVSCTSSSALLEHRLLHIIWDEKITGGTEHLCELHRKHINPWNPNQGIYSPILSSVFHCSGTDPRWWMIIIYSTTPDIYLMWFHLMCSLLSFTWRTFIYIVTVWIECVIVMGYMQEWAHVNVALRFSGTHYE